MTYLIYFIFGILIGSFINSLVYRLAIGEWRTIFRGRSFCPECQQSLRWYELVPIASFLIQKGRCRHCGRAISWHYLIVELMAGIVTLLVIQRFGLTVEGVLSLVTAYLLLAIALYDAFHQIILDSLLLIALSLILLMNFQLAIGNFQTIPPLTSNLLTSNFFGLVVGSGLPLLIVFTTHGRGMGIGDIKLGGVLGFWLGWPMIVVGLWLAFVIGAGFSVLLLGISKVPSSKFQVPNKSQVPSSKFQKAYSKPLTSNLLTSNFSLRSKIAFGPFLAVGGLIALLYGERLLDWYLSVGLR